MPTQPKQITWQPIICDVIRTYLDSLNIAYNYGVSMGKSYHIFCASDDLAPPHYVAIDTDKIRYGKLMESQMTIDWCDIADPKCDIEGSLLPLFKWVEEKWRK